MLNIHLSEHLKISAKYEPHVSVQGQELVRPVLPFISQKILRHEYEGATKVCSYPVPRFTQHFNVA
jgi:hypothetical protein